MDYVDFIVHVFSAEKRAFYGLERLRKSATTISVAALNAELKAKIASTRAKSAKPGVPARAPAKMASRKTAKKAATPRKPAAKRPSGRKPSDTRAARKK
jgi:ribosome-associated protein